MNKISVIIAVYNAERYLRECLDSIKNQTYKNLEIICVNDGSKDGSLRILEEYEKEDGRFKVFTKENEGLGGASARNYGLDRATGEYVSILDSDDFFDTAMLEKALSKAESADADITVFGGCEYDDATGNKYQVDSILNRNVIPDKPVFSYKDCSKDIFQLTQGMAWNKLFKRKFLEDNNLRFQRIKYTDDAYFTFLSLVLAERITVLDENLCFYRVNTGVSQTDGLANYPDSSFGPYIELKKAFIKYGVYADVEQSFINCAITFMRYFYDKINRYQAFEYLHEKYRNEIFEALGARDKPEDYFYDGRVYIWLRAVIENSPGEIAFKTSRTYGSENTTSSLRFIFPYDKVPKGSRVAMIGAGLIGRHYYSQIMLNAYCDIVCWVENNNPAGLSYISDYSALEKKNYDYVVIAYAKPKLIEKALDYLKNIGFSNKKIII